MTEQRVVITGIGVASPCGIGKDAFREALFEGASGIRPISLFDTSEYGVKTGGEIPDFQPQRFLGDKGLRTLDRTTKLLTVAAQLALQDASFVITPENSLTTGVVAGTMFGSLQSICDFDRAAVVEGPQYVNPALFPNTVINAPASQVSIRFGIKGFNATLATGFSGGLDAIGYAADFIRLGRAEAVLAGAAEELCIQAFLGFYKVGFLAGSSDGSIEVSCPFDKRRNGMVLGEGAGVLLLEALDSALQRKARIYGEIQGYAASPGTGPAGFRGAMQAVLEKTDTAPEEIGYLSSAADSMVDVDRQETEAIKAVFGSSAEKLLISSVKSMLGESVSASGALQAAAAVCALEEQTVPPTINYEQQDPFCDLAYVVNRSRPAAIGEILLNAGGPCASGNSSSLIISKFTG